MSTQVVCVGYKCPACAKRVAVLRSNLPAPTDTSVIESECSCGFVRLISISEIQSLDVWREVAA